jgi:hypothetical protein
VPLCATKKQTVTIHDSLSFSRIATINPNGHALTQARHPVQASGFVTVAFLLQKEPTFPITFLGQ